MYRCSQGVLETLCLVEYVAKQIKYDLPFISNLYRKSDNATCYASNSVAEIEYKICKTNGFKLLRHDYNEPQKGKDQADRESAIAKKYIHNYTNSNHDVISADDIKKGILYKNKNKCCSVSVISIAK